MIKFELNKECFDKLFTAFKNPTEVTSFSDLDHEVLVGKKCIAGYSVNGEKTILACGPGYGFYFGPTAEGDILVTLLRGEELVQEVPASQLTENEISVIRGVFLSSGNFETTHPMLRDIPKFFSGSGLTEEEYQTRKEQVATLGGRVRRIKAVVDVPTYRAVLGKLQRQQNSVITLSDWDAIEATMVAYTGPDVALIESANEGLSGVLIPYAGSSILVREVNGVLYFDQCVVRDGKLAGVDILTADKLPSHISYGISQAFAEVIAS